MTVHHSEMSVEDLLVKTIRVPTPLQPHLGLFMCCRTPLAEWEKLNDAYVTSVICEGLHLHWVDGFDPENPSADFWPYSSLAEVRDPDMVEHVKEAVKQGCMEVVQPQGVRCCASLFAVDKASHEAHPKGGRRRLMSLSK